MSRARRGVGRAAFALSAAVAACGTTTETREVRGTAVQHGEAIFKDKAASPSTLNTFSCATCHAPTDDLVAGRILPGGVLAGATERPSYWQGQERDLLRAINHCRYYFMSATAPWHKDDEEAKAVYAYLASLAGGNRGAVPFTVVASVSDVPAGDPKVGADVFARACETCHGAPHTGEGRSPPRAPTLPEQTLAEHAEYNRTDQRLVFIEKIRHGGFLGYGGNMPPFSKEVLSDADLGALLAFLSLY
jgi:thiosulfate dehydrogenase